MLSDPIFTTLDPTSARCFCTTGALLLVAGAGSGKTRAIVARIVRLLRDGVPARSILGITFTNRAAGEMRERVAKALVPPARRRSVTRWPGRSTALPGGGVPWLGTFHAFGATSFGATESDRPLPRFVIYDTRDQHDVLKRILKELNVDEKKFPRQVRVAHRAGEAGRRLRRAGRAFRGVARRHHGRAGGKAYDDALAEAGRSTSPISSGSP